MFATVEMQHQEFEPPEALSAAIKCFWHNVGEFGASLSSFRVQPDGYSEIIFHFGALFYMLPDKVLEPLPSPFIMGLLNKPAVFYVQGNLQIIGIRCFPWTIFDLLNLPSEKNLTQKLQHPIAKLQPQLKQLLEERNIDDAVSCVQKYFTQAHSDIPVDSMLHKAGSAMRKANGSMPVNKVAEAAHATVRTLERNFKQSSGHTVKDVSGLIRFEQVRNRLWADPDCNIAGLAHELGYSDQSHLNREFKRYSGATPSAFARKAKAGKKAYNDFVAFIQA